MSEEINKDEYQYETANYKTVEVKTEEEIERERREFIEAAEREDKAKAVNARAKRKRADLVFMRTSFSIIGIIVVILIVRWFMM